jgi:DnaK suppressor protein
MKRTQRLQQIAELLRRRRDALRRSLSAELEQVTPQDQSRVGDAIDAAHDSDRREITSGIAAAESRELASIERAIERLRAGRYGICEGCGKNIPLARLQALPYATMCIECQKRQEQVERAGISSRHLPDVAIPEEEGAARDIRQFNDFNSVSLG